MKDALFNVSGVTIPMTGFDPVPLRLLVARAPAAPHRYNKDALFNVSGVTIPKTGFDPVSLRL